MELENSNSVYDLITKLCQRFLILNNIRPMKKSVQRLRSKCYGILLSKLPPTTGRTRAPELEVVLDYKDPACHLLLWEFLLVNKYDLPEHAGRVRSCYEKVSESSDESLPEILYFLLQLRNPPEPDESILPLSIDRPLKFRTFDESSFRLKCPMICSGAQFQDASFRLRPTQLPGRVCLPSCLSETPSSEEKVSKGKAKESNSELDLWEIAANTVYTNRRTWESLGNPCPEVEKRFLTESPSTVSDDFFDLLRMLRSEFFEGFKGTPTQIIDRNVFIKHIKYLLVGITSDSFKLNNKNEFYLTEGITISGVSPEMLKSYMKELMFCGTCYKALDNFSNPNLRCIGNQNKGFIFKEFCEGIKRYLSYYRVATLSVSEQSGLSKIRDILNPLYHQLHCLSSICKVGPYVESLELPSGVALLNYLFQKLVGLTQNDIVMVVLSIFYPCIQVYFSHFIQQWLFDGTVNDPYNEFFVHMSKKYAKTRSRSYWTKCYSIESDIIPNFLTDLGEKILYCGKVMNLLKLCAPTSPLCVLLQRKQPALILCHLNSEQTKNLQLETDCYYLEAVAECGSEFSIKKLLERNQEERLIVMDLATKKRAKTIERLETEKLKKAKEDYDRKQAMFSQLKSDYDKTLQEKKTAIIGEVMRELKQNELILKVHSLRKQLVEKEALKLIEYYHNLSEISERKRLSIENHIRRIKSLEVQLENRPTASISKDYYPTEEEEVQKAFDTASDSSFHSATSDTEPLREEEIFPELTPKENPPECVCLDIINANSSTDTSVALPTNDNNNEDTTREFLTKIVLENKEAALRNKKKVMSLERGIFDAFDINANGHGDVDNRRSELTELQRNRLRVMSSEYGLSLKRNQDANSNFKENQLKPTVLSSIDEDNNNVGNEDQPKGLDNKKIGLKLDLKPSIFSPFWKSPNFEFTKLTPMSIGSTPLTAASNTVEKGDESSSTQASEDVFAFPQPTTIQPIIRDKSSDVDILTVGRLEFLIRESVSIPLSEQTKLADNQLLRHFFVDLRYLSELNNLRNYFFLLDGEFGRNITDGLFEKLYDVDFPIDLMNFSTLQSLVYKALDSSIRSHGDSGGLSFTIHNLPTTFDLGDPNVFDCLSLTYKVNWPLNVLLSKDVICKYDEVFKFLVKLKRVSWVLKKIFQELKLLLKQCGTKDSFLLISPEYNRMHYYEHIMMQFIQTLQNYFVGEVLQPSWNDFERNLTSVDNLNDLYNLHNSYMRGILFMCLLNKCFAPIQKLLQNVFIVILKFHRYYSAKKWSFDEDYGVFVHPNFPRLRSIFENFRELVTHFFKGGRKLVDGGYQPHLVQLLDMLDVNGLYSRDLPN